MLGGGLLRLVSHHPEESPHSAAAGLLRAELAQSSELRPLILVVSAAAFGLVPQPSYWTNPETSSCWASVLWYLLWVEGNPSLPNHVGLPQLQSQVPGSGHPGRPGIPWLNGKPWHREAGVPCVSSSLVGVQGLDRAGFFWCVDTGDVGRGL